MQTDVVVVHKHPLFVSALEDVLLRIQPKARIHCVSHDTWTVIPAETGRLFHGKLDSSIA